MVSVLAFLLINILFGFLLCFYGKNIVSWLVSIFIILITGAYLYDKYGYSQKNLIIFIVIAVVILLAFNFFIKFGLFLIGGLVGALLGLVVINYVPKSYDKYYNYIVLLIALVFAIITALSQRKILAFLTALAGANILSSSLIFLALNIQNIKLLSKKLPIDSMDKLIKSYANNSSGKNQAILIGMLIFTVLGFLFQSRKKIKK